MVKSQGLYGKRVSILGDGGWGTALAILLDRRGHRVCLWGRFPDYVREISLRRENPRFLPGVRIPRSIRLVSGCDPVLQESEIVAVAIPTQYIRETLFEIRSWLNTQSIYVSVAKGIELKTLKRPSQIIKDILGDIRFAVLSGPSHSEEVARYLPTSVVIASEDISVARMLQRVFHSETFRVYEGSDVIGVELGGAFKNIIALAAGICNGLGLGNNAKAALLTRGIVEIARLGVAMGAQVQTFFGLSGIGDLITTCYSPYSRNLSVGYRIGKGQDLSEILSGMEQVAEGVWTVKAVRRLAKRLRVSIPISTSVYRVLFKGQDPREAVKGLMRRVLTYEWKGLFTR
jgi:glycerol-3-phosphate dehydrogenase (NAD(P)+)